ncbi:MAG: GNAT family N-acetyltransferase [Deltaproteobacteria bacterium]|nr:GNAT family N-acetyltransferase [Deltaproteobacteria bacterium]
MRPDELAAFRATFIEAWAADLARVEDLTMDAARAQAAQRADADLEGALESEHHHLFVVTTTDETVGTLWFSVREGRAFVEDITIAEPHRGHGYGRRALDLMHEVLQRMGVRVVQLNVYAHNPRARALYERVGYEVTGFTMTMRLRG